MVVERQTLDLRDVTFVDSSGLSLLLELCQRSRDDGFDFAVLQGTGQVRRTIEIAGLDQILSIIDTGSGLDDG